jgi:hypothetical protein
MAKGKPKTGWFARIRTKDDALKLIKSTSIAFFVVAAVQGGIGVFILPDLIVDAVVLAALAFILMKWKLRTAAVLLLITASTMTVTTFLSKAGAMEGGTNIGLALFALWAAARATEATFKLRGRFAKTEGVQESTVVIDTR